MKTTFISLHAKIFIIKIFRYFYDYGKFQKKPIPFFSILFFCAFFNEKNSIFTNFYYFFNLFVISIFIIIGEGENHFSYQFSAGNYFSGTIRSTIYLRKGGHFFHQNFQKIETTWDSKFRKDFFMENSHF